MTTTNKTAEQMIEEVKAEIARVACFDWMNAVVLSMEEGFAFRRACSWRDTVREHARAGRMVEAQAMADRFAVWSQG